MKKTADKKINKRAFRRAIIVLVCIAAAGLVSAIAVNARVKAVGGRSIKDPGEAAACEGADCIIVLGCGVREDGTPSDMLRDRLDRAIGLYEAGAAPKLLMSGDHGRTDYDEVNTMKNYAVEKGVPPEDVFMDHAGFSTYETFYRAGEIFEVKKAIVVTQRYHLYRSLYIAERLGIEAYGVDADLHTYGGQGLRDLREFLARSKDFVMCVFRPEPTFLGEVIPISGDGRQTEG